MVNHSQAYLLSPQRMSNDRSTLHELAELVALVGARGDLIAAIQKKIHVVYQLDAVIEYLNAVEPSDSSLEVQVHKEESFRDTYDYMNETIQRAWIYYEDVDKQEELLEKLKNANKKVENAFTICFRNI